MVNKRLLLPEGISGVEKQCHYGWERVKMKEGCLAGKNKDQSSKDRNKTLHPLFRNYQDCLTFSHLHKLERISLDHSRSSPARVYPTGSDSREVRFSISNSGKSTEILDKLQGSERPFWVIEISSNSQNDER